ncbi:MAG TPA: TonB-dependent receptor [Chitinophagaceae bacterium]|jgi:iron complex outermembrane receptor protein|nr:TonB-dependent receptor [Chitinophagaceae bacterium]
MEKASILMIGFILLIHEAIAQKKDTSTLLKVTELDPVTVTSSINPLPISKTGRNIISIPGEEFSKFPVHSIDELLRYIPGIEIQMRGPAGSQSDIVIRGGTFQQVLVILDGIRLNDPNSGHFTSYIPIAPAEIDRIEILKGASSAIYGSEAVGGVIHIITKSFSVSQNKYAKQLKASAAVGEYNLINANIGGAYSNKKTAVSGGVLSNNSNGQLQRGARGFFYNRTASLSFKQFIDNWSVSARSAYDIRDFSAQNFYTTFLSDTAKEKVNSFWNQLQLKYSKTKHSIILDAGYKAVKDHYAYNPSSIANENKSNLFQLQVSDNFHLSSQTGFISGAQYQRKWIHSNDRGNHLINQAAAFIILNQSLNNFSLSPSLRLDYNERRSTELIPQINLSYHFASWQLRGSAGKTIRDADFTERYNNYNKVFVSGGSIGNPNLEAEKSFSYETGVDYFTKIGLKLSATIFRREQKNVIDWTPTPYSQMPRKDNLSPTGSYALTSNIAEVNTSGIETDIQYKKQLQSEQQVLGMLGFVWLDSKTSELVPSFYISSHAKFLTNFSLQYNNRWFAISTTGIYKHRKQQAAAAINAKVEADCFMINTEAEIFLIQKSLSFFVEVDNLLNNKSADLLGSKLPGRWLMGGIKMNLNKN